MKIAIVAITRNGAILGQKLAKGLASTQLFVSSRYAGQAGTDRQTFDPSGLSQLVASLWSEYNGLVFIMASGIVVRMIAPLLESKDKDPAVVVMDDAGKFAISLVSGHLGGANELAERCAFACGARAVITTATDANGLPSFDMLAKELDWVIDDISRIKTLNSLLLDGEEIAVVDSSGQTRCWFHGRGKLSFYDSFDEAIKSRASGFLFVTNRHLPPHIQPEKLLILRPRNLVLGIGCNRGTPLEEIESLVTSHLKRLFLSIKSVACIATAVAKQDEPGLVAFAEQLGVPLVCYESEQLNHMTVPSPPSQHAFNAIGAVGVAEPAALLASKGGSLLLKKVKSENATLAVAEKEV
ncbi:MAG TPA: cobalt-precorrin 5A hydrolase [Desulfuromonadaceae bacterium]|jgi:cobalt-precorrin 5A hydrolase